MITFQDIRNDQEINTYIRCADHSLGTMGFTEHSFAHVTYVAELAGELLLELGYDERTAELARIAGYIHDIGNVVNRVDHAQSGGVMAFRLLDKMGMPPEEVAAVVSAVGNHDEGTAVPVSEVAAALILADKGDVRRSRVRNRDELSYDIHDRVNYAVEKSRMSLDKEERIVLLELTIDKKISAVMDYFEIFLDRMLLCRRAANFLGLQFHLVINDVELL